VNLAIDFGFHRGGELTGGVEIPLRREPVRVMEEEDLGHDAILGRPGPCG
jgi:hypothetical protein